MSIFLWLVLGTLAGWLATLITSSRPALFANVVIGIIGAVVGGLVLKFFGAAPAPGFSSGSLITAILGAVILIAIVKFMQRPTA